MDTSLGELPEDWEEQIVRAYAAFNFRPDFEWKEELHPREGGKFIKKPKVRGSTEGIGLDEPRMGGRHSMAWRSEQDAFLRGERPRYGERDISWQRERAQQEDDIRRAIEEGQRWAEERRGSRNPRRWEPPEDARELSRPLLTPEQEREFLNPGMSRGPGGGSELDDLMDQFLKDHPEEEAWMKERRISRPEMYK